MSKELDYCKKFLKVANLSWHHPRKRIRIKNHNRLKKLTKIAIKKWGGYPLPIEWIKEENKNGS